MSDQPGSIGSGDEASADHLDRPPGSEDGVSPKPSGQPAVDEVGNGTSELAGLVNELFGRIANRPSIAPAFCIDRFEIIRELGSGGCGVVYLARDPHLDRSVALKVPHVQLLGHEGALERFEREGRAAAALEHPNLVPVLEVGWSGPVPFIVSPFIEGPNLAQWLQLNPPMSPQVAAKLMADVTDGVAHCHAQQVVHRDLKPSNILLAPAEWHVNKLGFTARIADFGLAKFLEAEATRTQGDTIGTALYMAPEVAFGDRDKIGPWTDVYSLGVILYELLAGKPPIYAQTPVELVAKLRDAAIPPPSDVREGACPALDAICLKCLQQDVRQRYSSAAKLRDDLVALDQGRLLSVKPLSRWRAALRKVSRHFPKHWTVIALMLLCLAAMWVVMPPTSARQVSLAVHVPSNAATEPIVPELVEYLNDLNQATNEWAGGKLDSAKQRLLKPRTESVIPAQRSLQYAVEQSLRWKLSSPPPVRHFQGHNKPISAAAVDPSGTIAASGDHGGVIKVWNLLTGEEIVSLNDREKEVRTLAFSPSGEFLLAGGMGDFVNLWETATWKVVCSKVVHDGTITCCAWHDSEKYLLTGSRDGTINLLSAPDLLTLKTWSEGDVVDALQWTNGAGDPGLKQVDLTGSQQTGGYPVFDSFWAGSHMKRISVRHLGDEPRSRDLISDMATVPYGFAATRDGSLGLCEDGFVLSDGGHQIRPGHRHKIRSAAIATDGTWAIAGANEGALSLLRWEVPISGYSCQSWRGHEATISAVAICPDNEHFISAADDGVMRLWSKESFRNSTEEQWATHNLEIRDLAISKEKSWIASSAHDGVLTVRDIRDGSVVNRYRSRERRAYQALGFLNGGPTLLAQVLEPRPGFAVWDPQGQGNPKEIEVPSLQSMQMTPDGRRMLIYRADDRSRIDLWDLESMSIGKALAEFEARVLEMAISDDGRFVAFATSEAEKCVCQVVEVDTGKKQSYQFTPERVSKIRFLPGQASFVVLLSKTCVVIDARKDEIGELMKLGSPDSMPVDLQSSEDGSTLFVSANVAGFRRSECFLFDVTTGRRFWTAKVYGHQAGPVLFAENGSTLITGAGPVTGAGPAGGKNGDALMIWRLGRPSGGR